MPLGWREKLTNADLNMECCARKNGKALLKVYYYAEKDGLVRKVIEEHSIETMQFFSRGIDED